MQTARGRPLARFAAGGSMRPAFMKIHCFGNHMENFIFRRENSANISEKTAALTARNSDRNRE
jgi:hypothetical protein